jgi:hypothetical protein
MLLGLCFALIISVGSMAQIHRVGGGLSFASGVDYNYGETGNPGLTVRGWLAVNRPSTLHIVPSVTVFNRYRRETGYSILTNYMLQGDLDLQYAFFQETSVRAVAFGGGNFTYLGSTFEALIETNNEDINDASDYAFGGNIGAGLELRMAPKLDFNVSAKYLFSRYSQFIISVQAVYFFKVRRRAYRR